MNTKSGVGVNCNVLAAAVYSPIKVVKIVRREMEKFLCIARPINGMIHLIGVGTFRAR